jgi:hypothetical protein
VQRLMTVAVISLLTAPIAVAQDNNTQAAQKAAESWLASVDGGDYIDSYDEAASLFKLAITKEEWARKVRAARSPLGKLVTRKLKHVQSATSLPGAPDGDYVVILYDSSFENKKSAVETIVPMRDKDGQWRVSGYFIR